MTELPAGLQAILDKHKDEHRRRVDRLEAAVTEILAGNLDDALRAAAERDAHNLAGSLGTFGLPRGSELARELEQRLGPSQRGLMSQDRRLAQCVTALREQLDSQPPAASPAGQTPHRDRPTGSTLADAGTSRAREHQDARQATHETGLPATDQAELTYGRVLVVDDDMPTRDILAHILSDAGYEVRSVGSAHQARRVLQREAIDLLLSDVSMPDETGLDLIRYALREHPQTATLLISALEDPGIAQAAIDFGAYGYLCKPVSRSPVLIAAMNALRRRDVETRERAARANLEQIVSLRTHELSQALARLEHAADRDRVLQTETIHRWAQAAEYRDPGVAGHLTRMSRCCALLARKLGLHAESLELASVLHDVGKVAIPDHILLKPGPLTADERLTIETHAEIGYEMLRGSSSSTLELAATIARTHHEKYDGSGYPRGLSGLDIPLEGRIAAVADVFDALTSERVYRPAWTLDSTITHLIAQRGKHFDPIVLDALLSSIDKLVPHQLTHH